MSINLCIFTTALMLFLTVDLLLCGILDGVGWHPERLLRTGQCQEDGGHEDTRTGPSMERGRGQGSPVAPGAPPCLWIVLGICHNPSYQYPIHPN